MKSFNFIKGNRFIFYKLLLLLILFGFPLLTSSQGPINTIGGGFRADKNNGTGIKVDAHGTCWMVKNASLTKDYFIPTANSAEWTNFINSVNAGKIPDLSLASCSCAPGVCCNSGNGQFYGPSQTCRPANGSCDIAEVCTGFSSTCPTDQYQLNNTICQTCTGANGACQLTGYRCIGTSASCGVTNPYTCNAPANDNVWNATSWAAKSVSLYCNQGAWSCNGTQPRRPYYGCNTTGTCNTTTTTYETATSCSTGVGTESASVCVDGTRDCKTNACSDGLDNDGDTWIDNLDKDCNPLACEQCTSGACCNTTTGCFLTSSTTCRAKAGTEPSTCDAAEVCTGLASGCPTDTYAPNTKICVTATGVSGSCSKLGYKCTGTSATCGVTNPYYEYASVSGTVWNGSSWVTPPPNCPTAGSYYCNDSEVRQNTLACNTAGACNVNSGSISIRNCTFGPGGEGLSVCKIGSSDCESTCNDGLDNDGDGLTDSAQDPDCGAQCTSGECCNIATGRYKPAGTYVAPCGVCDGTKNTANPQSSSSDGLNECDGSDCKSANCHGTLRQCGYKAAGTTCNASTGECDPAETCTGSSYVCPTNVYDSSSTVCDSMPCNATSGSSGACQLTGTGRYCSGSAGGCTGGTFGCTANTPASPTYPVYSGSSWISATSATNCGWGAYNCSGNTLNRYFYGCYNNGSTCNTGANAGNAFQANCGGGENSRCDVASGSCADKCNDGLDNDGDGLTDSAQDPDCGAQCTSGECCNVATGRYKPAGTYVAPCGVCDGTKNTANPQSSSSDGLNECDGTGCKSANCHGTLRQCGYKTAGTTCNASTGECDPAETCTGSSFTCPTNVYSNSSTVCPSTPCNATSGSSGACQLTGTGRYCSGSAGGCTGGTFGCTANTPASPTYPVYNGSSFISATAATNCGWGAYNCSGNTLNRYFYGCYNNGSTCNTGANAGNTFQETCGGGENSRCDAALGRCDNKCSDGLDNDGDTWVDNMDTNCNASAKQECKTGECCDTATGNFKPAGTYVANCGKCTGISATAGNQSSSEDGLNECDGSDCKSANCHGTARGCGYKSSGTSCRTSAGVCDPAETCTGSSYTCPTDSYSNSGTVCTACNATSGSSGACTLGGTGRYCSGTSTSCSGSTFGCSAYSPEYTKIWNGSSWVYASASVNCGVGYACYINTIMREYFGCTDSGSCYTTVTKSSSYASCATAAGGEGTSVCVGGLPTCQNNCSDGLDNDGDGWIDNMDNNCNPSACQQCAPHVSHPCCDSNGCYRSAGYVCGTGSCGTNNYGSSGSCTYTYRVNSCSGSSTSCDGPLVPSGATCNCPVNTVFNGTSCAAYSSTNYCGLGSPYCSSSSWTSIFRNVRSCNGSGSCDTSDEGAYRTTACASGYCVSGTCQNVACTTASHCGTNYNSLTACGSPAQGTQKIGYVPFTYACTNNVCSGPTAGTRVVTQTCAGRETHVCSYASCQNLCSNSVDDDGDGYNDANDTDCCGLGSTYRVTSSHCGLADSGCSAYSCGSYSSGTYPYNKAVSYYCQCETRPCVQGTYGAGGCCYPCPAGTYNNYAGSATCATCPAGQWCPGGTSGGIYCPYGSPGSAAGADSCSDCYSGTGGS